MSTTLPGTAVARSSGPPADQKDQMREAVRQARGRKRRRTVSVRFAQLGLVIAILGSWELMSRTGVLPDAKLFYGNPTGVGAFLWENHGHLAANAVATVYASFLGFTLGASSGIVVGLLFGRFEFLERTFDPVMNVLASLPRIALAPLFLLWFGISDTAKVALAISIVFFVVLFNTLAGVRSVEGELRTVATLLGASSRQVFVKVVLPGAVPVLFAGLRLALMFSILGVVGSEMIAARQGLGLDVVVYGQNLQPNGVFAVLAILATVSGVFSAVLRLVEGRLLRWMPERT
ncbi:ABC transporter permease [Spirillospora sp. NPDC048819]|uniref:ABC transporter permease n=1 Tax=Spirillospora sp. NPDC048819 TaxID=3155268 RepID=UPI0033EDAD82